MKKLCTKCEKVKNEAEFPLTQIRGRMVHRSWCDSCMKAYYKAYAASKAKNKAKRDARLRPAKTLATSAAG
jgi:hypothetical protein